MPGPREEDHADDAAPAWWSVKRNQSQVAARSRRHRRRGAAEDAPPGPGPGAGLGSERRAATLRGAAGRRSGRCPGRRASGGAAGGMPAIEHDVPCLARSEVRPAPGEVASAALAAGATAVVGRGVAGGGSGHRRGPALATLGDAELTDSVTAEAEEQRAEEGALVTAAAARRRSPSSRGSERSRSRPPSRRSSQRWRRPTRSVRSAHSRRWSR